MYNLGVDFYYHVLVLCNYYHINRNDNLVFSAL
jgi:hypothetical protein